MNRAQKGLRAFVSAIAVAAIIPGGGSLALSLTADASNTTQRVTTAVNVRSGPGTSHSRLGVLYPGESVVVQSSSDGWAKVSYNGKTGYVSTQYLSGGSGAGAGSGGSSSSATGTVSTTANLNLRTGPSLGSSVSTVAPKGTKLSLTGSISGSYSQVTYNGATLWASTQYLTASAVAPSTGTATTTANLNLRSGPSTGSSIYVVASRGTTLALTGTTSGSWTQITYNGRTLWASTQYLTTGGGGEAAKPTPPSTPSTSVRYATTALNIWNASTGSAYSGEFPRGAQINITGKVSNGRAEIVHNGAIRWVTAKYLSTSAPSSGSGSSSGSINKGYSSGLDRVNADAQKAAWYIWNNYPQIKTMYGYRKDVTPDHPAGRAVDVMIPSYKTNSALGWQIANYFKANAKAYNISYIMFDQKIWSVQRDREGWRTFANRGSDTANHKDHVHLNTN